MRTSVITDWRMSDADLPDIAPGEEYERVIRPQKFVVLHRILVRDMALIRLQIGAVDGVPFRLEGAEGSRRGYRLTGLDDTDLKKRLIATGATVATPAAIAIVPGLEVRVFLRNEGDAPVKPRCALLVQEEIST